MLNLHKLDVFIQVVEAGSFSRAADGLLMSQSAVSHHMRDLEVQLGTSLFARGPRGVTLTTAGETLKTYAIQILALLSAAENAVTDVANLEAGEVYVGATPGVSTYLLPDCIISFRDEYANLSVVTQTNTSAEILTLLRAAKLDVGIIEGEVDKGGTVGLQVTLLHEFEQLVIVCPSHPWWDRGEVAFAELDAQEFIMRQPGSQTRIWLDDMLDQHGISPHVNTVFDNIDSIKRAVVRGSCLTIMPAYTVETEVARGVLQALSIKGQPLRRTLKLVQKANGVMSPSANVFLRHVEDCLPYRIEPNGG